MPTAPLRPCGERRSDGAPWVVVGDTMWFSVELLRQIADTPNPVHVRVKEIRIDPDGAKMLVLERA